MSMVTNVKKEIYRGTVLWQQKKEKMNKRVGYVYKSPLLACPKYFELDT